MGFLTHLPEVLGVMREFIDRQTTDQTDRWLIEMSLTRRHVASSRSADTRHVHAA
jgi:hypothetical protein